MYRLCVKCNTATLQYEALLGGWNAVEEYHEGCYIPTGTCWPEPYPTGSVPVEEEVTVLNIINGDPVHITVDGLKYPQFSELVWVDEDLMW